MKSSLGLLALGAWAMLLVGCGTLPVPPDGSPPRSASLSASTDRELIIESTASDAWAITVSHPQFGEDQRCSDDSAVDTAIQSADMPSSSLGITLNLDATEEDALRIATCLDVALVSGDLTIYRPTP